MTTARRRPASRKGNTGKGVLIGLGIGCAVIMLLCAGLLAVLGVFGAWVAEEIGESVERASSNDPEVVREVTAEITEIEIPEDFEPEYSFKMEMITSLPLPNEEVSTITPRFVVYEYDDHDGVLMLANVENLKVTPNDMMELARSHWFDSEHWEDIEITQEETREMMVRGEPATFEFARGRNRRKDEEFWRVFGTFEGKHGPAGMLIFMKADDYNEEMITEIINSIE